MGYIFGTFRTKEMTPLVKMNMIRFMMYGQKIRVLENNSTRDLESWPKWDLICKTTWKANAGSKTRIPWCIKRYHYEKINPPVTETDGLLTSQPLPSIVCLMAVMGIVWYDAYMLLWYAWSVSMVVAEDLAPGHLQPSWWCRLVGAFQNLHLSLHWNGTCKCNHLIENRDSFILPRQ